MVMVERNDSHFHSVLYFGEDVEEIGGNHRDREIFFPAHSPDYRCGNTVPVLNFYSRAYTLKTVLARYVKL